MNDHDPMATAAALELTELVAVAGRLKKALADADGDLPGLVLARATIDANKAAVRLRKHLEQLQGKGEGKR